MRRTHRRTTRKSVLLVDGFARALISMGGIGTIIAVLGVCIFLVWVVVPLFKPAEVSAPRFIASEWEGRQPLHVGLDEFQAVGWSMMPDGAVYGFRLDTGEVLFEKSLFADRKITSASFRASDTRAAIGFADGTVDLVEIGFETQFYDAAGVPRALREELADKPAGSIAAFKDGIAQLTPEGQYRQQTLRIEPIKSRRIANTPIHVIDHIEVPDGLLICALTGPDDAFELKTVAAHAKEDFLTGGATLEFGAPADLPVVRLAPGRPRFLEVSSRGNDVYAAWGSGEIFRVGFDGSGSPFIAERGRLTEPGAELTHLGFILGDDTLVWGDSRGEVGGGFTVRVDSLSGQGLREAVRDDRARFALAASKDLGSAGSAMISMAPSSHSRLIICGFADGSVRVYNVTNESLLAKLDVPGGQPIVGLCAAPKEDGFIGVTPESAFHCRLDPRHPEASLSALFWPVWYEGYPAPQHMWQSSSATDDTEPKLGLMPLVFGSTKATFYAMLFGAPLALLAAIYSSQFLSAKARSAVKPTIELMAGLPSVVLGFLAALVFAPFVENVVPSIVLLMVCVPFAVLLGAYVWQLLPASGTRRLAGCRPLFLIVPLLCGVVLAVLLGPLVETVFFAGDLKGWLAWDPGSGGEAASRYESSLGGWLLLCFPAAAFIAALLNQRLVMPWMRRLSRDAGRSSMAWLELVKFSAATLFAAGLALAVAALFDNVGMDLRADFILWHTDISPLDTHVQRNALIVGFVMGFAIIPIIYTIADDALSAVPEHLRSASLGSGATTWQTAVRIVIPTAMSGLFSALMVGLGRAVGETMIVLMALGNTAIMDLNIFNGARTLSANIAVELPEAVRNSTHYRTLFLAALVLFTMTFVVNTVAEVVRLRFRRRAVQL